METTVLSVEFATHSDGASGGDRRRPVPDLDRLSDDAAGPALIRVTVRSPLLATQTEPSATAMPFGARPTAIRMTTEPVVEVDLGDRVLAGVGDPGVALADRDAARPRADLDLADDLVPAGDR